MNLYTDIFAIDIGTSSIKLIALDQKASGAAFDIANAEMVELPRGLLGGDFTSPTISNLDEFKNRLGALLKRSKKIGKGVVIGLPDRWVKIYLANLDITENERKNPEFLKWRVEKILPIPEGMDVMIDYQMLDAVKTDTGYTCQIIAAAVKKEMIEIMSSITAELKIEVMAFDTSSLGLFNLYEDLYPVKTKGQSVINLHIGHETTVVKAYKDGKLLYERVIEVAGEEFTKLIAETDNCELDEAEKIKHEDKCFPVDRADVQQLLTKRIRVDKVFGNWLRELNVTFRFFQQKFNVAKLPAVFITGGGAMLKGLPVFLSEYLETPCRVFNPFEELRNADKIPPKTKALGPVFAPCLGLLSK